MSSDHLIDRHLGCCRPAHDREGFISQVLVINHPNIRHRFSHKTPNTIRTALPSGISRPHLKPSIWPVTCNSGLRASRRVFLVYNIPSPMETIFHCQGAPIDLSTLGVVRPINDTFLQPQNTLSTHRLAFQPANMTRMTIEGDYSPSLTPFSSLTACASQFCIGHRITCILRIVKNISM